MARRTRLRRSGTSKMLARLRSKIVLMILLTSGTVVVIAFVALFAFRYNAAYSEIHNALKRACEAGPSNVVLFNVGRDGGMGRAGAEDVGAYLPTAVFVVDDDGNVYSSNASFVEMDDDVRDDAIADALASPRSEGRMGDYGVFYRKVAVEGGYVIAFADATQFDIEMANASKLLVVSGVGILAALLLLSLVLARAATWPVQQAWEQQSEFIANASHELKTPLTVLIANNDIMAAHPEFTPEERATWLEGSRVEAEHMKGLIEDMLTLARGEQAQRVDPADLPAVDLSALVERSSLAFDAVAFERGVTVDDDVARGISVRGDEQQLERMVKTLVDNAVKYAGAQGSVSVKLTRDGRGRPVLSVTNTGDPIPPEDLPHVFDRFWRSDAARARGSTGGYGLGLAIAKSIAEEHGAQISVRSSSEAGTTFTVVFSRHD